MKLLAGVSALAIVVALAACQPSPTTTTTIGPAGRTTTTTMIGTNTTNPNSLITGRWNGTETAKGMEGILTVHTVFGADGSYSSVVDGSGVNGPDTYQITITGTYSVDASLGLIKFTDLQADPSQECFPNAGCTPTLPGTSETDFFSMAGSHTLTLTDVAVSVSVTYSRTI